MKRIIKGKKYDTETAKFLYNWDNGCGYSDFNYCEESLYRKKTGEFFLFGEGGANSKYSVTRGNNCWGGGEAIVPLTLEEAKEWAEYAEMDVDIYEEIFGEVEE